MINYNNNKQLHIFQDKTYYPTEKKADQKITNFEVIEVQKFSDRLKQQRQEKLPNWQTPKVIKNEREWEDINQIEQKKQIQKRIPKQIQIKEAPKQTFPYQKNIKKEGETSQNRLMSKLNFIINAAVEGNQEITVSNCSAESVRKSNNSQSESIYSNDRQWREQFYKEKETKQFPNNKKVHNQKIVKGQKKIALHEERLKQKDNNGYKYLFFQQSSFNSQILENQQESNKKKKELKVQSQLKVFKKQNKPVKQKFQLNSEQNKINYIYQKGKHKVGESKQQRVKNKLGFLLDNLEKSGQLVSVSCNSENYSLQASLLQSKLQEQIPKEVQQHQIKNIQNQVIFAQNQNQIQAQPSEVKQRVVYQSLIVQQPMFEELENRKQIEQERSQIVAITPKQTIDLDKSFKSKNSKLTPKSKILSQSLDKSNTSKSRSRIISQKTPPTIKNRKNSLESLNQVIKDIQKKSQSYRSAVGNSVRSKDKSQVGQQSVFEQNHKKFSVKSNRKISAAIQTQIFKGEEQISKKQSQISKNSKNNAGEKIIKKSVSSRFDAQIQQIELEKVPNSILIKNQKIEYLSDRVNSQFQKISEPKQIQNINKPQSKKQTVSISSKQQSKKSSSVFSQSKTKQQIHSTNVIKKSEQQYKQESEAIRDKLKIKQLKQIKQPKAGYLKTLLKEDIDESDLVAQFLPKNKIQFKIDISKRTRTEVGSVALQNKKFQALLKKRQTILAKKAKQQFKIDPRSFLFPESSSGVSKQSSMKSNQHSFSETKLQMLTARNFVGQSKTKFSTNNIAFKRDSFNTQRPYLPIVTARTQQVREQQKYVYTNSDSLRKQIYENITQNKSRNDSLFQKRLAFKEQTQKVLQKQPTVKIEFHGLSKNKVNENVSNKKLQPKQKYLRLKQLLASQ